MSLEADFRSVIEESGAHFGIAMRHLERGDEVAIDGDEPFPMCSVLKIPVLVEAFRQMRSGRFKLDDRWTLTTAEKNLPSGVLLFFDDGLEPTVRDLLTLMIIISDNTATDMVMHRLGTATIQQTMHDLGLTDIYICMTIREIFETILPSADPTQDLYQLAASRADAGNLPGAPAQLPRAYSCGPDNDVSTPRAMTRLLELIWTGKAVDRAACDGMLEILLKQQLNDRLPRFLPPGTRVAHKTGTLSGFRNDAGILYVNDENHIAVTAYSRWDAGAVKNNPLAERQRIHEIDTAFGKIGKLIYDRYSA